MVVSNAAWRCSNGSVLYCVCASLSLTLSLCVPSEKWDALVLETYSQYSLADRRPETSTTPRSQRDREQRRLPLLFDQQIVDELDRERRVALVRREHEVRERANLVVF